jgi:thioredoxin 1
MAADLAVTTSQFDEEVLRSDLPVLVDFWATWCAPCLRIAPFVEEIAAEFAGRLKVYKVDVDAEGELGERYGILSIPTLLVFKGGQIVDSMQGAGSKADIAHLVERHL